MAVGSVFARAGGSQCQVAVQLGRAATAHGADLVRRHVEMPRNKGRQILVLRLLYLIENPCAYYDLYDRRLYSCLLKSVSYFIK